MSEDKKEVKSSEKKTETAENKAKLDTKPTPAKTSETKKKAKRKSKGKIEYKPIEKEEIKPGMLVRVHQKIVDTNPKGEEKERIQVFQGMVLAHKHGQEAGATITVRKVTDGIGVEKIFPLNMPSLAKFEFVRNYKTRQAKPYHLRAYKKKLKEIK